MQETDLRDSQRDGFILQSCPAPRRLMLPDLRVCLGTFVVVPHADLEHAAQARVGGDVEDVQAVSSERSHAVQVSVSAAALAPVETDADVSRGTWSRNKDTADADIVTGQGIQ